MALDRGLKALMTQTIVVTEQSTSTGPSMWGVPVYNSTSSQSFSGRYVADDGIRSVVDRQDARFDGIVYLASTGVTAGAKVQVPGSTGFQPVLAVQTYYDDQGDVHHQKLTLGRQG